MNAANLPAGWPEGKRLAVSVNIMCEAWTDDAAPGIGPMGNPLKAGVLDSQRGAHGGYFLARDPTEISMADIIGPSKAPSP